MALVSLDDSVNGARTEKKVGVGFYLGQKCFAPDLSQRQAGHAREEAVPLNVTMAWTCIVISWSLKQSVKRT